MALLFETTSTNGNNVEFLGDCTELEACNGLVLLRCAVNAFVDGVEVPGHERDHVVMTFENEGDGLRPELWMRGSNAQIDAMLGCYR